MDLITPRRKTRAVRVGDAVIGGDAPILVQSMITEETKNVDACVAQIIAMYEAGCELVRVTTPTLADAHCLGEIKAKLDARGYRIPLVADVHHQGTEIAAAVAEFVDKVRINPGLFVYRRPRGRAEEYSAEEHRAELEAIEGSLLPVIEVCKRRDIAMRIGVNHGSLAERMLVTHGDTPKGMVESAMEYLRICEKHDYRNLVISLKASRVPVMIAANRLMAQRMDEEGMDYPLHLGVTEAGDGQYARVKSTAGIATLLAEGIGDTIRVSLAEDPINELPVCYEILQALGLRRTQVEFVACPGCGRTKFDLPTVLNEVRDATRHLVGLNIAVMGCLPPGQRVMTADGPADVAEVTEGTRVLTGRGRLAPVTAVSTHAFAGELVEIQVRGAPPVLLTPNHPVLALTRESQTKGGRRRWQNVAGTSGRWCADARWFAAGDVGRDQVLLYPIVQDEQDLSAIPQAPYLPLDDPFLTLAGCYLAKGSIGGHVARARQIFFTFGMHEADLAAEVQQILASREVSASIRVRPEKNTREVIARNTALASLFADLFGRGAGKKRLPLWMLTLPRSRQKALLRALWRCDGYVGEVRGYPQATYVTISPALAYAVHQMLLRQGIPARLSERRPINKQRVYLVNITSADALRWFSQALDIPVALPEGRARCGRIAIDDHYLYLPVLGVRSVPYSGPVHNLDVERDHTFVASLSLVHNCIVNGPGEMADADYGYVGKAGGKIALYRGREVVKESVPQEQGVDELVALIKADGKWVDPPEGGVPPSSAVKPATAGLGRGKYGDTIPLTPIS
jgi:(E)-4-hydroxy-3-methylbut-2-enyl-diphosphate synthase